MIEDGNRVVLCAEVIVVNKFLELLETPVAEDAKDLDGDQRELIQLVVVDKSIRNIKVLLKVDPPADSVNWAC